MRTAFTIAFFCLHVINLSAQKYIFPLKVTPGQRYLTDQKNKPFFYNGDTGWKLFLKLSDQEVLTYLQDRKSRNFTVIQVMLTGFKDDSTSSGQRPFKNNQDFSTANPDYFEHVAQVIRKADSLGLLMAIAPLWAGCCGEGYGGKGTVGPNSLMSTNGPEKTRNFGEWIGKKFSGFNNILWIIGGDMDPAEDRQNMEALAAGIKSQAPHQLMTYHASSSHSSTDVWKNPAWLDVVMTYTYFRGFNKAWTKDQPDVYEINYKEYKKVPVKPFFIGESTYEGEHDDWGSALQVRKQAYWSVLSGGTGNAYGSPLWNFPQNWRTLLEMPGGNSMKHFHDFFSARAWYELIPDPETTIIKEGAGNFAYNNYAIAASEKSGKSAIVYVPSGRTLKINATIIKSKNLTASWFDPRNGSSKDIGKYKNDRLIDFTTPDNQDWVLVLKGE